MLSDEDVRRKIFLTEEREVRGKPALFLVFDPHEVYASGRLTTAASYVGVPMFVVDDVSRNKDRAVLGLGLGTKLSKRLSLSLGYNGEIAEHFTSQTASAVLNYSF